MSSIDRTDAATAATIPRYTVKRAYRWPALNRCQTRGECDTFAGAIDWVIGAGWSERSPSAARDQSSLARASLANTLRTRTASTSPIMIIAMIAIRIAQTKS